MRRRTVLAGAAIVLAGCNRGGSEPDDSQGGARRVGPTPDESELPEFRGEWLEAESDNGLEVSDHRFHYTGERTQPFVVDGTVVQSSGQPVTVRVSVTFLDADGMAIHENYDLVRDLESGQEAEFSVEFEGEDPEQVENYELIAEIQ